MRGYDPNNKTHKNTCFEVCGSIWERLRASGSVWERLAAFWKCLGAFGSV